MQQSGLAVIAQALLHVCYARRPNGKLKVSIKATWLRDSKVR